MKITKLSIALLLSSSAFASPLDPRAIKIETRIYGETPCNFYYGTKGDIRVSLDLSALTGLEPEFVTLTYGFDDSWTKDYSLNQNPQSIELKSTSGAGSYSAQVDGVKLAERGGFHHESFDFLFSVQTKKGEIVDLDGGDATYFSAKLPYSTAACNPTAWSELPIQILDPNSGR